MTRAAAVLLLLLLPAAGAAKTAPTVYTDARAGFKLTVPEGWQQVTLPESDDPAAALAVFANDTTDQILVVTKIPGVTEGAYSANAAFFTALEAGVAKSVTGYKRISAKQHKVARKGKKQVPAYDLWFKMERDGATVTVGARYLFFKGYSFSLVIDSPTKKTDKPSKKIVESFLPAP